MTLTDIMISDINVLRVLAGYRVGRHEDGSLVVSCNWYSFKVVPHLSKKVSDPDYLSAAIGQRHVFCLSRGMRCRASKVFEVRTG